MAQDYKGDGSETPAVLETVAMLEATYCLPGELTIPLETRTALESLHIKREDPLYLTLHVNLEDDPEKVLDLQVSIVARTGAVSAVQLRPPSWLGRREFIQLETRFKEKLSQFLDGTEEDGWADAQATVMGAAEAVRDVLQESSILLQPQTATSAVETNSATIMSEPVCRIWMHLPSLSTRSKRQDLVDYASTYGITGIVCAGKPGLLILEAPNPNKVESYLSFIKTHSWADIPAGHKKITERLRESDLPVGSRVFADMREITEEVYSEGMRGHRGIRGDLGSLRAWLEERGLGDRLARALGANF